MAILAVVEIWDQFELLLLRFVADRYSRCPSRSKSLVRKLDIAVMMRAYHENTSHAYDYDLVQLSRTWKLQQSPSNMAREPISTARAARFWQPKTYRRHKALISQFADAYPSLSEFVSFCHIGAYRRVQIV